MVKALFLIGAMFVSMLTPTNYYFKAEWCAPCRTQNKIIERLQKEGYDFKIYDYDKHPEMFKEYDVTTLPTIIIIKNGEILKLNGIQSYNKLKKVIN